LRKQFLESGANDHEKSQSTLNELSLCWRVSRFSRSAESESTAEHQPKRGRLLRNDGLLQRRRRGHVLLQEENEARQECSRLLQWQGRRGMLLQGRFVPDA
jgi:arylamine N-acetyltransferase